MKLKKFSTIIILIILTYGCGFSRIYQNFDPSNIEFKEISYLGSNELVYFLRSNLNIKENKFSKENYTINFKIVENFSDKTKNSSGQIIEELISVSIVIKVKKNNNIIDEDTFAQSKTITVTNNLSYDQEVRRKEKESIILNLIQQILFTLQTYQISK